MYTERHVVYCLRCAQSTARTSFTKMATSPLIISITNIGFSFNKFTLYKKKAGVFHRSSHWVSIHIVLSPLLIAVYNPKISDFLLVLLVWRGIIF
jgi:hypothetical protein